MKTFLIFATAVSFGMGATLGQAQETIKASVYGMVCAFCAQGIDKSLRGTGVAKEVFIDLQKKIVAVELVPNGTLSTDQFTALVKAAGYDVKKVERVKDSVETIRKQIKS